MGRHTPQDGKILFCLETWRQDSESTWRRPVPALGDLFSEPQRQQGVGDRYALRVAAKHDIDTNGTKSALLALSDILRVIGHLQDTGGNHVDLAPMMVLK
jgi:hypothetical protein